MRKSIRFVVIVSLLSIVLICFLIWLVTKPAQIHGSLSRQGGQAILVKVIHPVVKPVPVTIQEIGNVEAGETVKIISQVSGILKKIDIQAGQDVQQGQLLFEVDPSVYATDVAEAEANLQRDKAKLALLQATAERYKNLAKLEYVTRQQYEEALAAVSEQESVISADNAQLQQKQLLFEQTRIRAPISGKVGVINVNVGDLISANNPTPLLTINRLDPVLINFNIGQDRLQDLLKYQQMGTLKVKVLDENGEETLAGGDLIFISNIVSGQTGTIQVKAKAPNPNLRLWPGQIVMVKLILTIEQNAMVVPTVGVQLGQKGSYVYLVKDNRAQIQPVQVERQVDGEMVISQGLQPSDNVIAEVPAGLNNGDKVQIDQSPQAPIKKASPSGVESSRGRDMLSRRGFS